MGAVRQDVLCALLLQCRCRFAQRIAGVNHVIHEHTRMIIYFTDNVHDLGLVGTWPSLVDDSELGLELLGQGPRPHHPAHIRRHD